MALGTKSQRIPVADAEPATPGTPQAGDRSRKIIEAAYALLDEDGLEGVTIRALLKRTGLSRRAFYERFAGKDDLMLAVFEHTLRLAAQHYAQEVAALSDPLERLKRIVTSIVRGQTTSDGTATGTHDKRSAALSREHLRLGESRPDALQAALSPLRSLIAQMLDDGMKQGLVHDGDPERMAALIYNLVSTTVHAELLSRTSADRARRAQLADDIWAFCQRAIAR